jgi:tetratricopeptide (TPR) repeat protein
VVQVRAVLDRAVVGEATARDALLREALDLARTAGVADPGDPFAQFVAAEAAAGLGDLDATHTAATRAVELCPGLDAATASIRQMGSTIGVRRGLQAYSAGDTATAVATWEAAARLHPGGADAPYNLGAVLAQRGDWDAALARYRQAATALGGTGPIRAEDAAERRRTRRNVLFGFLGVGAGLFQQDRLTEAAAVFGEIGRLAPRERNGRYNLALALYQLARWDEVVPAARGVLELDPLNHNALLLLHGAHRELGELARRQGDTTASRVQEDAARATLAAAGALPVQIRSLELAGEGDATTLSGVLAGGIAPPGSGITIEFTVTDGTDDLGSGTLAFFAPERDEERSFTLSIPSSGPPLSFRYRLVD